LPRIAVMPPDLASQIAAGEVVERPASAVKELVENALDAGATRIAIELDGGGVTRISVSDDGHGMGREDAALAIERHATSKLFAAEDLSSIGTFGFRGEALPSIASVSRFSLRTRIAGDDAGTEVTVEGGRGAEVRPVGIAVGTTVEVKDLFFNVVARRKFLRSASTESGHVADVVEAAALSRPDVTFTFTRDGRRVREWLKSDDRGERVRQVAGDELAACAGTKGPLGVMAYLSRPEHARTGTAGLRLFVNSRPIRDRALSFSIAQAYGSVLERGRYPRGVVYLELPPQLVDVNVHPQKAEVRFADHRAVTDGVYHLLSAELSRAFSLPSPSRSPWGRPAAKAPPPPFEPPRRGDLPDVGTRPSAVVESTEPAEGGAEPVQADATSAPLYRVGEPMEEAPAPLLAGPSVRWGSLRFVAQVRQTYLVCEGPDGLYIIDQHAAAERVNFDRLRRQYRSRAVPSQAMLFPAMLQMTPEECEFVEERSAELQGLGVELRVRGVDTVSVHALPRLLGRASPERVVRDLLAELSRGGRRAFSDAIDLALATMACHGSVRAGDKLSESEAAALLAALDSADFAGHCPHGRPVVAVTSWNELERKVGRR
jgi:DNA mismatch repair protein MutL